MEAPVAVVVTGGEEDGSRRRKRSWGGGGGGGGGKSAAAGGGVGGGLMDGFSFSPASPPRVFWNSRRKSANGRSLQRAIEEENKNDNPPSDTTTSMDSEDNSNPPPKPSSNTDNAPMQEATAPPLSDRRRALFEPLDSTITTGKRARIPAEELLPPPDFDNLSYPKGWLVGKKRKLVNVDVVESMRRIAVQEMNRKDREIDGLNEQLEEDARCLERLQLQLLEERSKRADVERDNAMLQNQVAMLMDMLQEGEEGDEPHEEEP